MEYTVQQIEEWKSKAQKWDDLDKEIGEYYKEEDEEDDFYGSLIDIGELAASAFGYL